MFVCKYYKENFSIEILMGHMLDYKVGLLGKREDRNLGKEEIGKRETCQKVKAKKRQLEQSKQNGIYII